MGEGVPAPCDSVAHYTCPGGKTSVIYFPILQEV